MQEQFVNVYRSLRDKPQIVNQQDAEDYAEIFKPAPPSKAHIKRLQRCHEPAPELRGRLEPSPRYEFFKSQMAILHGSRTIRPAEAPPIPPIRTIAPARSSEYATTYPEPKPLAVGDNKPLRRQHYIALARMVHVDFVPNFVQREEIVNLFGSLDAFDHAKKAN